MDKLPNEIYDIILRFIPLWQIDHICKLNDNYVFKNYITDIYINGDMYFCRCFALTRDNDPCEYDC